MARNSIVAKTWLNFCLLLCVMVTLLHKCQSLAIDREDTLPMGTALTANQTLLSKNGTFALGFFSPNNTNNWYIGIWYAKISEKTIVWVANRENPLRKMPGVLKLSRDGYLRLYDLQGRSVWTSDNSLKASWATMLESGNLVMVGTRAGNISEIVWESFQHPVDTWLPGMKMWKGMKLTSWKSSSDPAPGPFSFQMDPSPGKTQLLLISNNRSQYSSTGEWNGEYFANMPGYALAGSYVKVEFVIFSPSTMYCSFTTSSMIMGRAILEKNGLLRGYYMIQNGAWMLDGFVPRDQCNVCGVCGANAVCNGYARLSTNVEGNANVTCTCLQGFRPKNSHAWDSQEYWLSGCVHRSPLQCSLTNSTDGFLEVKGKHLADDKAIPYSKEQTLSGCQHACLNNCSCMAFWLSSSSPPVCRLWFGDFMNVRDCPGRRSFYLRLAASELRGSTSKPRNKSIGLHILLPGGAAALGLVLVLAVFIMWKRGRMLTEDDVPTSLRTFTFRKLQVATNNFRHKLGSGSFGSVFKGTLPDNTLVAVKELKSSAQAEKQFRAEITTIGNIHHVNLVRLLGFCAERSRRLLVYEYMPNGSLESLLFRGNDGEAQGELLNWKTRFQIALGTARGLAYIHEECIDRIIHCDIKPENILLDAEFCPRVADFGMAKLVGRDFSRVLTTTRGTIGYLAPEWISGLPITPKADVYSFGITLLEIISGRRNIDLNAPEPSSYLFHPWAADQVHRGNLMALVDGRISGEVDAHEVRRAIAASILCIQEDENVRPTMAQVVNILEGIVDTNAPQIQASLGSLPDHHGGEQEGDLI
ncbi:hypothetical protein SUGI_0556370 [Cryptomeria japonica]|uniref:G-type lectin S-receptor-like serine/threonine-protein kinase At2g19130 n=1 Tax=Cryptomeria japonica TaxID=3369 RepID=UPI002408BDAF|nr:G-type lectin S-receptor-like serine/threonine-protein kinase At2g19130 [Cryptomeria japonica]GLJ28306.1 hypothetical protein SUGI_0556370 [Cryptomeria japonica]